VAAAGSVLGLVVLSYVAGAAAMHFDLPSADYLAKAFKGGRAWMARQSAPHKRVGDLSGPQVTVDDPTYTADGFTLYTTNLGPRAALIDMRGRVIHEWSKPFSQAWPQAQGGPAFPDGYFHWFRCHLYPNGDLLAVYHADNETPYGYGLVKLDKDSNLLWSYPANVHHDADVGEDGRIYTLTQHLAVAPPPGLEALPSPYIADTLVVLSPEGRELETVPLLEAFRDSPYSLLLTSGAGAGGGPAPGKDRRPDADKGDVLHANSVKVLPRSLASKFPLFKPGQVLISLRSLDAVAVLDVPTRRVVWAARGVWRGQHDADFLDSGRLLLFDNLGWAPGARVLEYDPVTQAVPWSYAGENASLFAAGQRGAGQRLANGNTLIVDPDGGRLLEVTADKKLVWECYCLVAAVAPDGTAHSLVNLTSARRYAADGLTFLKGGPRVRP
jgi:hypothetical protein